MLMYIMSQINIHSYWQYKQNLDHYNSSTVNKIKLILDICPLTECNASEI